MAKLGRLPNRIVNMRIFIVNVFTNVNESCQLMDIIPLLPRIRQVSGRNFDPETIKLTDVPYGFLVFLQANAGMSNLATTISFHIVSV